MGQKMLFKEIVNGDVFYILDTSSPFFGVGKKFICLADNHFIYQEEGSDSFNRFIFSQKFDYRNCVVKVLCNLNSLFSQLEI